MPNDASGVRWRGRQLADEAALPELSDAAHTITPVLTLHRSERSDALVAALGEVLREPGGDPFQREIVAVPSRGVERWLA